jgi:ADP-ribose pyrophosphatase YjhB (NUDIX family)
MNAHENAAQAAERECLEETGLQVKAGKILAILTGREHAAGADIFIAYEARILSGELKAGDDANEAEFFPLNNLPQLAFKSTYEIIDKLRNNLMEK